MITRTDPVIFEKHNFLGKCLHHSNKTFTFVTE